MIGVISEEKEKSIVEEFFQAFKTPWEFFRADGKYNVILSTGRHVHATEAKLFVVYGREQTEFDRQKEIETKHLNEEALLECGEWVFPIYRNGLVMRSSAKPLIKKKGSNEAVAIEIDSEGRKILRIGFNLFEEVKYLLSSGQPSKYAHIPTLDIHISMLRSWILSVGIPLVEIPPVPAGYDFMVCLTHDVDFVGVRNHKLDHTMLGFVYRAVLGSLAGYVKRHISLAQLLRNWKAVFLLPFVYYGIVDDFWVMFERYLEIEKNLRSTFFFIPFKGRAGKMGSGQAPQKRATKYDLDEVKAYIKILESRGFETALHGIDAWHDEKKGLHEFKRIVSINKRSSIGVRMHWLYFKEDTPELLEQAGFTYDSTLGYNDAVGYWGGTTQVFKPLKARKLLELPLHIQDTSLFYKRRMGLNEFQALHLCKKLIKNTITYGGVLVLNWHQRSLAPERLWGNFYIRILDEIKKHRVWFGSAKHIVDWFRKRRDAEFSNVKCKENSLKIKCQKSDHLPLLSLRIYEPPKISDEGQASTSLREKFYDIPYTKNTDVEIKLSPFEVVLNNANDFSFIKSQKL